MIALYFLALFSLSQSANLVKLSGAPPDVIGFWRLIGTSLILLPFVLRRKFGQKSINAEPLGKTSYLWPALSAVFFFAHLWTYVYSAQHTTIAHCMIIYAINPLFTSLGAYQFLKEPLSVRTIPAYALGLLGLYILLSQSLSTSPGQIMGDISALISAALFAGYILTGKKARATFTNLNYTFIIYLIAGTIFGLNGLSQGLSFTDYPPLTFVCIIGIILFPTLLGHSLFSYLMKYMNLGVMTCGKITEPLMSVFFAYLLFGEKLTLAVFLSFLCTGLAMVILFWKEIKRTFVSVRD